MSLIVLNSTSFWPSDVLAPVFGWFWLHMLVIDKLAADSPYHHLAIERLYLPGISDISDMKYITYIRNELVNLIWSDPVLSPFLSEVVRRSKVLCSAFVCRCWVWWLRVGMDGIPRSDQSGLSSILRRCLSYSGSRIFLLPGLTLSDDQPGDVI